MTDVWGLVGGDCEECWEELTSDLGGEPERQDGGLVLVPADWIGKTCPHDPPYYAESIIVERDDDDIRTGDHVTIDWGRAGSWYRTPCDTFLIEAEVSTCNYHVGIGDTLASAYENMGSTPVQTWRGAIEWVIEQDNYCSWEDLDSMDEPDLLQHGVVVAVAHGLADIELALDTYVTVPLGYITRRAVGVTD